MSQKSEGYHTYCAVVYRGRRQYLQVVTVCQKVTIIQGKETVFASGNCVSEGYYYTGEGDSICKK